MSNFDLKSYLSNNKLLTESINPKLNEETTSEFKTYDEVQIGDTARSVDDPENDSDDTIVWKGTREELKKSKFINLLPDFMEGLDDESDLDEYDLVVVNTPGYGYSLTNYNNDPSGVIVYKEETKGKINSLNEEYDEFDFEDYDDTDLSGPGVQAAMQSLIDEYIDIITNNVSPDKEKQAMEEVKRVWFNTINDWK